jgi:quinol monooxygenase YgiN
MSELLGIVRFKFHEGKVDEFKRLSARAMEIVRAQDTGTLQYDTYFNADESGPSSSSGSGTRRR